MIIATYEYKYKYNYNHTDIYTYIHTHKHTYIYIIITLKQLYKLIYTVKSELQPCGLENPLKTGV